MCCEGFAIQMRQGVKNLEEPPELIRSVEINSVGRRAVDLIPRPTTKTSRKDGVLINIEMIREYLRH